ncbi:MAG: hypothetical protein ABEK12_02835 [Candidatus Nanohaloarchaea archaeon]
MGRRDRLRYRITAEFERLLDDPEAAFQAVKRGLGVAIGLSVAAVGIALGLFAVLQGETMEVFTTALLFWTGYLFAHYAATGRIIHPVGGEPGQQTNRRERVFIVIGALMALVGATVIPLTVARGSIVETYFAAVTVLAGYLLTHYGLTDALL